MKKEKSYNIGKIKIYIQYFFWHFGFAIDYEKYVDHHNFSILLPFIVIAFEVPFKNKKSV